MSTMNILPNLQLIVFKMLHSHDDLSVKKKVAYLCCLLAVNALLMMSLNRCFAAVLQRKRKLETTVPTTTSPKHFLSADEIEMIEWAVAMAAARKERAKKEMEQSNTATAAAAAADTAPTDGPFEFVMVNDSDSEMSSVTMDAAIAARTPVAAAAAATSLSALPVLAVSRGDYDWASVVVSDYSDGALSSVMPVNHSTVDSNVEYHQDAMATVPNDIAPLSQASSLPPTVTDCTSFQVLDMSAIEDDAPVDFAVVAAVDKGPTASPASVSTPPSLECTDHGHSPTSVDHMLPMPTPPSKQGSQPGSIKAMALDSLATASQRLDAALHDNDGQCEQTQPGSNMECVKATGPFTTLSNLDTISPSATLVDDTHAEMEMFQVVPPRPRKANRKKKQRPQGHGKRATVNKATVATGAGVGESVAEVLRDVDSPAIDEPEQGQRETAPVVAVTKERDTIGTDSWQNHCEGEADKVVYSNDVPIGDDLVPNSMANNDSMSATPFEYEAMDAPWGPASAFEREFQEAEARLVNELLAMMDAQ